MEGVIVNFRGGRHTQRNNQMIVQVAGVENKKKATALLGKTVSWTSPGKNKVEIKGKIEKEHGNSGALKVVFEKGMPGQSLGQKVKIQ
ncbi:MAG: 50S ribosomal protein L35ae [bacterium]|nr:50S ribosomal protein L35ae [bacterium]